MQLSSKTQSGSSPETQVRLWGEMRYNTLSNFLRSKFGQKVYKVSLDAGFSCPNRDGTLGTDGCIFCSPKGSGDFAGSREKSVKQQLKDGIDYLSSRYGFSKFIAYYQAFTNTYGSPDFLREQYSCAMELDEVAALAVATRPDCLDRQVLEVLKEINLKKYLWVELGLQTMHSSTAALIRRGYELECFESAVLSLNESGIDVVVHIILGLPHETREMMLETVRYISNMKIAGVKFQLLHVLKDTYLAEMYENREFELLAKEKYINIVTDCLEILSPEIVVHRLTGDGPRDILVGPLWSEDKIGVLKGIERELVRRHSFQGRLFSGGQFVNK